MVAEGGGSCYCVAFLFVTCMVSDCFFFFSSRRRHTRFDCDWSSDVCSSDLTDIDLDLLVAGISLPIFMPAVRKNGALYLDAVWIKDANLTEAVKRGAEELWLVWCIGNTGIYRNGFFNQYVHMIEMSAAGSLNEELAWIGDLNARIGKGDSPSGQHAPIRLHVIKPEYPLPLDPDFYLGRIDAATLVDMGYRDAMGYLGSASPDGVALNTEAAKMKEPVAGITFREMMAGGFTLGETDPLRGREKGKADRFRP